jgi:lipopolysaccharide transport system permease protein
MKKVLIPEGLVKKGFLKNFKEMFDEIIQARELIIRLFIRDFLARYKQSFLGITWIIIMPIIVISSFIFMNKSGILNIGNTSVPYPVFALLGLTIYQIFSTGLVATTNSLVNAGSMIIKINFPKESLIISSMAHSIFDFIIRVFLLILVFIFFKVVPSYKSIIFPFLIIPLVLLTIGLGFILSLLNCIARDTTNAVSLLTSFLLFITPVLYPEPKGILKIFTKYNIISPLINAPREIVINGYISKPDEYIIASLISIFIFLFCWRIFHLVEPKIAERV